LTAITNIHSQPGFSATPLSSSPMIIFMPLFFFHRRFHSMLLRDADASAMPRQIVFGHASMARLAFSRSAPADAAAD